MLTYTKDVQVHCRNGMGFLEELVHVCSAIHVQQNLDLNLGNGLALLEGPAFVRSPIQLKR